MNTLFGSIEIKVYKDPGSSFIRCHEIKSNDEYIHNLQPDGLFESGIYRYRFASGNTAIGSIYFRRSGREEDREFCLYRDDKSGDIHYYDDINGKYESGLRTLAKYRFNPETLDWTNMLDV